MSTIVTIHGTRPLGCPEKGNEWWKESSQLEAHLRELIAAETGDLRFQSVRWDGKNSEQSRRTAAKHLAAEIRKLEANKEPYVIIGHSHGGSVIANVVQGVLNPSSLTYLANVITIGTPYITFHERHLFFDLGLIEKSIYVSFIWLAVLWLTYMMLAGIHIRDIIILPLAFIIQTIFSSINENRHFARYSEECPKSLSERWICLFDCNDEALLGLGFVNNYKLSLFPGRLAVPALSFASIFVLPLIVSIVAASPQMMRVLDDQVGWIFGSAKPQIGSFADNLLYLNMLLLARITTVPAWTSENVIGVYLILFLPSLLFTILVSLFVTLVIRILSIGISEWLSRLLDTTTSHAMRDLVLGSDLEGESAANVIANPSWTLNWKPLPQPLSNQLMAFADQEAVKSLPKLRKSVYELAFSIGAGQPASFVQSYLSWNELIHTSYFDVAHFRMLLGFAISRTKGFKPTPIFKNDREFPMMKCWFEEIAGRLCPTAPVDSLCSEEL
jgi:hypothetical protein